MQNKGLIKFLTWAFALVCLFQLSFSVATRIVENHAREHAKSVLGSETTKTEIQQLAGNDQLRLQLVTDSILNKAEADYLDSMASEKIYLGYTYRQCQAREINLGLDLKGGMNVMMEVSTADVVRALANHTEDPLFNTAVDNAIAQQKKTTNEDFVSLFYQEIQKLDPNVSLRSYFSAQTLTKMKASDGNDQIINLVKEEAGSAYDRTFEVLRQRIDKFGVAQPTIQKLEASERILIELPGVKEPERVRKLLQGTAQLEFWLTYDNQEAFAKLVAADGYLATMSQLDKTAAVEDTAAAAADSTALDVDALAKDNMSADAANMENQHPLFAKLQLMADERGVPMPGPYVGIAREKDRSAVSSMLAMAQAAGKVEKNVKFLWDAKPMEGTDLYHLYAIKITTRDGSALLGGDIITDAHQDFQQNGSNEISMTMNPEGARAWKRITGENINKSIAIVLDDVVYSAPNVLGEIAGGRSSITGNFTLEEAKDLANILKSGKLPAPAVIVQEAVVGPSLGQESIEKGLLSFILAFVIVLVYMVVFYNRAGWVSVVALITNVFLLMGVLASVGTVLTLPGIAGIVLTMAMAVDGNVIIYERIKEELRAGKSLVNAVDEGFKNAYSAIIDGQVTTFLLGLVLIAFGSGPVQGFAVTLCIGIVTSLFTSIFITRLCIDWMLNHKKKINFSFSFSENFMSNTQINFLNKRKVYYTIAIAAIVICLGGIFVRGMNFGIDFSGGRTYVVRFDQAVSATEVRSSLADVFPEAPEVKTYGPNTQLKITTKYLIDSNEEPEVVNDSLVGMLYTGTSKFFDKKISKADFQSTETNNYGIIQSEQVGPTIANDLKRSSVLALIGGLLVMFVYVALRFRNWKFGVGSVTALAHDSILIIGLFALLHGILPFNLEVDQSFIAAVLTIIGYSINATVVIFDRVRENKKLYPKRDLMTQMNDAINATLARTINTSGTTFFTLLMMFIFGGESIRGFIFALLIGVLCGVFSSVCIACPVVYEVSSRKEKEQNA